MQNATNKIIFKAKEFIVILNYNSVAQDPNYKRKLFWYDLVEKTIRCVSIRELLIQALLSGFGFFLQLKLILYYINTKDYVSLAWTLAFALMAGIGNALFFFFHRYN